MEPLLAPYHLPFEAFRALVADRGILITDLLALDGYLLQNGIDSSLSIDTMNVWISHEEDAVDPFVSFLMEYDYVCQSTLSLIHI